ncbi:MAG: hypothetical protein OEW06_08400 [Gemmatimonadota bacterium]|nr:hypothetical protein [Gemmatimonadota bacterium]MDH4351930.1 hypothetical protein [Gemmatimonadota bacterium]
MNDDQEFELTPDERAAFARLPREQAPGRMLEERTVHALRAQGLLGRGRQTSPPVWRTWPTAAAAAVALFVSGIAVGQWIGSRTVAESMTAVRDRSALEAAAAVQRAGSAYVTALAALAEFADSTTNPGFVQGREVALTALYAAARELTQLTPDDPLAVAIRQRLEAFRSANGNGEAQDIHRVAWF